MSSRRALCASRSGAAEERLQRIVACVPPCCVRNDRSRPVAADRHERRTPRRHQPLVGVRDDHVEARRIEGKPAGGLRRVDDGQHAVLLRGRRDGAQVGDLARRHLHRAERDDVHVRADRVGELVRCDEPNRHAAVLLHQEREEERGELDVGRQYPRSVRNGRGDLTHERRDVRPDRDRLDGNIHETREGRTRRFRRFAPVLPARPPPAPVVERNLQRIPRRRRRQAVRRGVQVDAGGRPERLGVGQRERLHPESLNSRR